MIKSNAENEVKVVNQLMTALNLLSVLSNEEELARFIIQAIKNVPGIVSCCICMRGVNNIIGDFSEDAEAIIRIMNNTLPNVADITIPKPINKNIEIIKLQTSDRKYGYLLFKLKHNLNLHWLKPVISNFINLVAIELERRRQKKEIEIYHNFLELKVEKTTTELKNVLVKKLEAELKLKNSKEQLTTSQKIAKIGSWSLDLISNKLILSKEVYRIFGFEPHEITPSHEAFLNAIHPDDRNKVDKAYTDSVKNGENSYEIEHRIINNKTGKTHFVFENCMHTKNDSGKVIMSSGIIHDITESKLKEKLLFDSEQKFKAFTNQTTNGITVADFDGNYIYVNPAFCNMSGYTEKELLKKTVFDMKAKNQPRKSFYDSKEKLEGKPIQVNLQRKDKTEYLTEIIGDNIKIGGKRFVLGTIQDISERVKIENKILKSEYLLRESQKNAKIGSFNLDIKTFIWEGTSVLEDLFGIGKNYKKDLKGWINLIHPVDKKIMDDYFVANTLKKLEPFDKIFRVIRNNDKQIRWFHGLGKLEFDADGKPSKLIGTIQDITEQKKDKEKLSSSEKHYRNLFENSPSPLWEGDFTEVKKRINSLKKEGLKDFKHYFDNHPEMVSKCTNLIKILDINNLVLELYETDSKKLLMEYLQSTFTENSFDTFKELLIAIAENKNKQLLNGQVKTLKGNLKNIRIEWVLGENNDDKKDIVLISTVDITEQKKNIKKIKESQKKIKLAKTQYQNLINALPQYIYHLDTNLRFISANKAYCDAYSVTEKEIIGKTSEYLFPKKVAKNYMADDRQVIESGEKKEYDYLNKNIGDDIKWIRIVKVPVKDEDNNITGMLGIFWDITTAKKADDDLKINLAHLDNAQKIAKLGYAERNLNTGEGYWSHGLFKMLGIEPQKTPKTAQILLKKIHPDHADKLMQKYEEISQNEGKLDLELKYLKENNAPGWVHVVAETKKNNQGELVQNTIFQEISERKKTEEELKEALNITRLGSFVFNDSTSLFETSLISDEILGIDKSYKIDREGWLNLIHPDDHIQVKLFADNFKLNPKPIEVRVIRPKDKKIIWILVHIKKKYNNRAIRTKITGTIQDITNLIKAKQELEISEERWQFAIDGSGLGLWDWNMETDEVFFSTKWKSMLGYKDFEIENRNEEWEKRVHPDDKESIDKIMKRYYEGKTKYFSLEYRLLCKDNTYKWILDRGKIISYNKKGKPTRMIGTHTDITADKEAIKSVKIYSNLVKESLNEIYLIDVGSYKFIDANNAGLKNLGYSLEELLKLTPLDIAPNFNLKSLEKLTKPLKDKKESRVTFYTNHQRKDGTIYPVEVYLQMSSFDDVDYFYAFTVDISERKKVEEALVKSEEQLSIMFNYAPLGIALVDSINGLTYKSNLGFSKIIGRSKKEISQIDWMSITHPDDLQEDLKNMSLLNSGKITGFKMDKRFIQPNGKIVWVNMTIAPLYVEDKTKPQHLCMIEDITERKIAELEFLNSQQHLENAQNIAQLGYFETNLKTKKTIWSKGMYQIIGYSKDEITPDINTFNNFIHPDDFEIVTKNHQITIKSKDKIQDEFRLICKSGKIKWLVTSRQCKKNENGEPIVKGVLQDITTRKEAEQTVIKEKELLKAVISNIPIMLTRYNPDEKILYLNTEFENKVGWKTGEIQNLNIMEKVFPDSKHRKETLKFLENPTNKWKEFKIKTKAGKFIESEWSYINLEDGTKISIGIDITERKKYEKKLVKYQEHLEELVNERTQELTKKNNELDKAMKVFVGRELKIRELQKKNKKLEEPKNPEN